MAIGCLAAILIAFAIPGLWHLAGALYQADETNSLVRLLTIGFSVVWLGILGLGGLTVFRRGWVPLTFRADRASGAVEFVEQHIVSRRERRQVFALMELAGLSVETAAGRRGGSQPSPSPTPPASSLLAGSTPNVRVRLRLDDGSRKPKERSLSFHVEGVDRREEVADFAYRLGAACGLAYQRVVRSDPRDIELEISPSMGPGHERIPPLEGRADYTANVFSAAATTAAVEERVPPFDPSGFPCDHKVAKWLPGREVIFRKPLGGAAFGCLPFAIAGLLVGPGLFILSTSRRPDTALADRLIPSAGLGFFGLIFGLIALAAVASALPRRVTLDWARGTISIGGLFRRTEIPLQDVAAIEARCVHTHHQGGKNSASYHSYRCEVQVHRRDPASGGKPVVLVATREFREDPDTPYRRTLPLVTELAEALGVERRVTDYS